ncbi:MAG: hypothetical protein AB1861_01375 [Cyanobacteriota bacterium]
MSDRIFCVTASWDDAIASESPACVHPYRQVLIDSHPYSNTPNYCSCQ